MGVWLLQHGPWTAGRAPARLIIPMEVRPFRDNRRSQKYESVAYLTVNFEGSVYAKYHLQMPMICIFHSVDPPLLLLKTLNISLRLTEAVY